jgi:acyl dehydratase
MPESAREVIRRVGEEVGVSPWVEMTQERIDLFAKATGDFQWIHVDRERAASSPFGGTIAHGYLTLSMIPALIESTFSFAERTMGVNYGSDRVRFIAPVPSGTRIRARFKVLSCEEIADGGFHVVWSVTMEREGTDKPVMIAQTVSRLYF